MWAPQVVSELVFGTNGQPDASNGGKRARATQEGSAGPRSEPERRRSGAGWVPGVSLLSRSFAASEAVLAGEERDKALNPFQTIRGLNAREWVKVVLGACIVAPLRFLCILVVLGVATVLMSLTVAGVDVDKPLSPGRARAQELIARASGRLLCICVGIYRIRTIGSCATTSESKMVVVAPHSTVMDPLVIACALGGPASVGKLEAARSIIGPFLRATQSIFVDRESRANRSRAAEQIKERVRPSSAWRRRLVLFPEGTCTNRTSLISFRRGAFEPGAPVQPVVLHWSYTNMDPSWTAGAPSRLFIVLRTLSQGFHSVTVEFLPVYVPSASERNDPIAFANNVRRTMAATLGLPVSEHSYEDSFLARTVAKAGLQPSRVLPFSMRELRQQLSPKAAVPEGAAGPSAADLYRDTNNLLLCFAKAPGLGQDCALRADQFEQIAQLCADSIGLGRPLAWSEVASRARLSPAAATFHDVLVGHLCVKYNVRADAH